jgi:hypothetical protein
MLGVTWLWIWLQLATGKADRIPVGARISTPIQTSPGVHLASYAMGTGSFPGLKQLGRGVNQPPPPSAEVKETAEYTSTPLCAFMASYGIKFILPFIIIV